jgi:serine/threonine protein kinase
MNDKTTPPSAHPAGLVDPALPAGSRLGPFELQVVLARSTSTVVYQAIDHSLAMQVAIQEYLPARLVRREPDQSVHAIDAWQEDALARGLRAFVDEARMLVRLDHPALVRVLQLREANGTAYRVMPFYRGERLLDLRRDMQAPPDEGPLRALAEDVLGALAVMHAAGKVHGAVSPANILLLSDDHALLLGPGAANAVVGSDLVETLMATLDTSNGARTGMGDDTLAVPTGVAGDLYALAQTIRFCITGKLPPKSGLHAPPGPIAAEINAVYEPASRPRYRPALLDSLDAAMSPFAEDRPLNVAQFRSWLERGPPPKWRRPTPSAADTGKPATATATAPPNAPPVLPPSDAVAADREGPAWPGLGAKIPRIETPTREPNFGLHFQSTLQPELEPLPDEIKIDQAAWVPPELPPQLKPHATAKRRRLKVLWGSVIAALAAVVVVLATDVWHGMPALQLEKAEEAAAARAAITAAPPEQTPLPAEAPPQAQPQAAPRPDVRGAMPSETPAPVAAAPTASAPSALAGMAGPTPAPAEPVAAQPAPSEVATVPPPAAPAVATEPPSSTAVATVDPEKTFRTKPTAAGTRATSSTRTAAAAPTGNPRAACAGRSEFALYRCMQVQCGNARWVSHPQCVRLRESDRVD